MSVHILIDGYNLIRQSPTLSAMDHCSLEEGRELLKALEGHITGFAIPQYVLTTPLGKISLCQEALHRSENGYWVENYCGQTMNVDDLLITDDSL